MTTTKKADNTWSLLRQFAFRPRQEWARNGSPAVVSIPTANQPIENLLTREWLLTNERSSYASSTIACCNTRGYHGLLIGSLNPPVNRIMALSNCLEMVILKSRSFKLSTFEFNNKFAPTGFTLLKQFRRDIGAHFHYELYNLKLTKSVYLMRDRDTAAVVYDFTFVQEPMAFVLRPFVGLRDFHSLQKSNAPLYSRRVNNAVLVRHDVAHSCELLMSAARHPQADGPSMEFEDDRQWWFNFVYRSDKERGQAFTEDLWTPGFFKCRIDSPTKIVLWANLSPPWARCRPEELTGLDIETVCEDLRKHEEEIKYKANSPQSHSTVSSNTNLSPGKRKNGGNNKSPLRQIEASQLINRKLKPEHQKYFEALCLTADRFIVKRQANSHQRTTIVAGYPWFADWGRDAFIAMPGLMLSTGRFEEAKSVLTTFATTEDEGMIPNRFDDRSETAHFNSVDASLWFINAAFQYLQAGGDSETFNNELLPTIHKVIESYYNGTRFDIHADTDELITAGDNQTQLTWMDAKFDGVAFTPRYGKAVEVNALWYNVLCLLSRFYEDNGQQEHANHYRQMAQRVQTSFRELFWNESKGYLNDCILPDGTPDDSLRPNQIFAVSLGYSALSADQQRAVVKAVQEHLLTSCGLRTLNVQDGRYKGIYTGPQQQRDEAYHQGTVWAYLMGPFVEAYLKVNGFSRKSKKQAAAFIKPLLEHLTKDGCLGSVSEIFDGDEPHQPKGCFAQAWSVGELIRAYQLINS